MNEFVNNFQLILTTRLKSTRVMEHIAIMVRKDEFIFDVMIAGLRTCEQDPYYQPSPTRMSSSNLYCRIECNLDIQ